MRTRSTAYLLLGLLLLASPMLSAETVFEPKRSIEQSLSIGGFDTDALDLRWSQLDRFYALQQGSAIWHENGSLNRRAEILLGWIVSADTEGLQPEEYHLARLGLFPPLTVGSPMKLRELLLTDAYLRLAEDLYLGRFIPHQLDPFWFIPRETFDSVEYLAESLRGGDFSQRLAGLRPQHAAYLALKKTLARYRVIEAQGGWPRFEVEPTLRPGDLHPAMADLRFRLTIEGDLPAGEVAGSERFDKALEQAVKAFQRRTGLNPDGRVGPLTREALNVPVAERIAQIRLNLERWRWLPHDLGERYLLVNTAGYELSLSVGHQGVLHSLTINGKAQRQTPSFTSQITHLVVNPDWTVPRLIAVEDLLPKQQQDASFLGSREIQVLRWEQGAWVELDPAAIDWSPYHEDNFPFTLRQAPGRQNSLGRVKFQMSNPYDIYLHGTPAVGLFNKPVRAFSSGCVRVQKAPQLARELLLEGRQPVAELLNKPLQNGETRMVKLSAPVPVYLAYFTGWVDDTGVIQFRPDIYQRNETLLLAFTTQSQEVERQRTTASLTLLN